MYIACKRQWHGLHKRNAEHRLGKFGLKVTFELRPAPGVPNYTTTEVPNKSVRPFRHGVDISVVHERRDPRLRWNNIRGSVRRGRSRPRRLFRGAATGARPTLGRINHSGGIHHLARKAGVRLGDKTIFGPAGSAARRVTRAPMRCDANTANRRHLCYRNRPIARGLVAPKRSEGGNLANRRRWMRDGKTRPKRSRRARVDFLKAGISRKSALALGASEDAAGKRVNRALEKLRKFFTKTRCEFDHGHPCRSDFRPFRSSRARGAGKVRHGRGDCQRRTNS